MRPQGHPEPPARGHEPHTRELCTSVKSCRVSHTRVAPPVEGSRSKWIAPFWALWERTLPGDPERTRRPSPRPACTPQERGAGGDGEQLQSYIHTACPRSTAKSRARHGQARPPACIPHGREPLGAKGRRRFTNDTHGGQTSCADTPRTETLRGGRAIRLWHVMSTSLTATLPQDKSKLLQAAYRPPGNT